MSLLQYRILETGISALYYLEIFFVERIVVVTLSVFLFFVLSVCVLIKSQIQGGNLNRKRGKIEVFLCIPCISGSVTARLWYVESEDNLQGVGQICFFHKSTLLVVKNFNDICLTP